MDSASNRPGGLSSLFLAIRTFAHSSATNSGHPAAASTSVETSTLAPSEKLLLPVSNTSNIRYSSCASITLAVKKDCLFQSPPCCKPPSPPLSRIAPTANIISTQAVMINARFFIFHVPPIINYGLPSDFISSQRVQLYTSSFYLQDCAGFHCLF